MDLVLLVDFFPETLGNETTLWLHSAGKISVDASAAARKELVSVTHTHIHTDTAMGAADTCSCFCFACILKTCLHKQECEHFP